MKVYTRKGDEGNTSLFNGERTLKCGVHMKLVGSIDSLVAQTGLLRAQIGTEEEMRSSAQRDLCQSESQPEESQEAGFEAMVRRSTLTRSG